MRETTQVFNIATQSWSAGAAPGAGDPQRLHADRALPVRDRGLPLRAAVLVLREQHREHAAGHAHRHVEYRPELHACPCLVRPRDGRRRALRHGGRHQRWWLAGATSTVYELNTGAWPGGAWVLSLPNLPAPRLGNMAGFDDTSAGEHRIWSVGGGTAYGAWTADAVWRGTVLCPTPTPTPSPTPTPIVCNVPVPGPSPAIRLTLQDPQHSSALIDTNWQRIPDTDLISWLAAAMAPGGGPPTAQSAILLFQECYGGGMLDGMQSALGALEWVGASAADASHNSWGDEPRGFWWTRALADAFGQPPVLAAVATAAAAEATAHPVTGHGAADTWQWVQANGGEGLTLADECAAHHYAILWAGVTVPFRHDGRLDPNTRNFPDLALVRSVLTAAWGNDPNHVTIITLYGDGEHDPDHHLLPTEWHAQAATADNLRQAIANLHLTAADQLVFFAGDHGDLITHVSRAESGGAARQQCHAGHAAHHRTGPIVAHRCRRIAVDRCAL